MVKQSSIEKPGAYKAALWLIGVLFVLKIAYFFWYFSCIFRFSWDLPTIGTAALIIFDLVAFISIKRISWGGRIGTIAGYIVGAGFNLYVAIRWLEVIGRLFGNDRGVLLSWIIAMFVISVFYIITLITLLNPKVTMFFLKKATD